jgi:hypothetical protein
VPLVSGKVAQAAFDTAAKVCREVKRRLVLALLVLLQDFPDQGGLGPTRAFSLILQPAE